MGLGKRVWLAFAALLAVMALIFGGVVLADRSGLITQTDNQLRALAGNSRLLVAAADRAQSGGAGADLLGDVYVGIRLRTGRVVTVLSPASDPGMTPVLRGNEDPTPTTRPATGGNTRRVRVLAAPLAGQRTAVVALALDPIDAAVRRLALLLAAAWLLLAVGLLAVATWVRRLGLKPIADITARADAIAAGADPASIPRLDDVPAATEAGRLASAFNTMLDTTVASQQQLRQFIADASHELRTPLTTLQGYSSLYEQGGLTTPAAVADAMRRMNAEAGRMSRMVDGLLDLAALDRGSALKCGDVDLATVLREVAGDLQVTDPDRPVLVDAPDHLIVRGDGDRLRQAVLALVSNARRYSAPDAPISLAGVATSEVVRIEVIDHGRGIDPQELPRLFDRFYRGGDAQSRGAGGSGLGLAIVAAIVNAHGGRYGATSTPGQGSTFWFTVPAKAARAEAVARSQPARSDKPG